MLAAGTIALEVFIGGTLFRAEVAEVAIPLEEDLAAEQRALAEPLTQLPRRGLTRSHKPHSGASELRRVMTHLRVAEGDDDRDSIV